MYAKGKRVCNKSMVRTFRINGELWPEKGKKYTVYI